MTEQKSMTTGRNLVSRVTALALLFSAVDVTQFLVRIIATAGFALFLVFIIPFVVLFYAFAYFSWRQNRWGYLGGAITSLVFVILNGSDLGRILSTTADPEFASVFTVVVSSLTAVPYGIYGFYTSKRPATTFARLPSQISPGSILALLMLGFVIGGLFIGALSAGTISRLLSTAATGKDVIIVPGAVNVNNGRFYDPATLTVNVGKTVVWFNKDTGAHTVTSTATTPLFDSANMDPGIVFQYTFNQAGTYDYVCTYHSWMTGKVIVQ